MKKSYYSVNGQISGEQTAGQPRVETLTDALGSVTATVDQNAQVINTYRYKPYGELLAKTGTGTDPAFQWVGSQGYRNTGREYSDVYVRARHHSSLMGRWTTSDPWEFLNGPNLYQYVLNSPATYIDRLGQAAVSSALGPTPGSVPHPYPLPPPWPPIRNGANCGRNSSAAKNAVNRACKWIKKKRSCIDSCFADPKIGGGMPSRWVCMDQWCNNPRYACDNSGAPGCQPPINYSEACVNAHANTGSGSSCIVWFCPSSFNLRCHKSQYDRAETIMHELMHCCGIKGEVKASEEAGGRLEGIIEDIAE